MTIDHELQDLGGKPLRLSSLRGKALLLVNTASECGFTPQYDGLQLLHERFGKKGLVVIGLPSNDFGGQEPGSSEEIRSFCSTKFHVTFPMMAKLHATGDEIAPLYRDLTIGSGAGIEGPVMWNFTKFLIDAKGIPVARFEPKVAPLAPELIAAIEAVLPK